MDGLIDMLKNLLNMFKEKFDIANTISTQLNAIVFQLSLPTSRMEIACRHQFGVAN